MNPTLVVTGVFAVIGGLLAAALYILRQDLKRAQRAFQQEMSSAMGAIRAAQLAQVQGFSQALKHEFDAAVAGLEMRLNSRELVRIAKVEELSSAAVERAAQLERRVVELHDVAMRRLNDVERTTTARAEEFAAMAAANASDLKDRLDHTERTTITRLDDFATATRASFGQIEGCFNAWEKVLKDRVHELAAATGESARRLEAQLDGIQSDSNAHLALTRQIQGGLGALSASAQEKFQQFESRLTEVHTGVAARLEELAKVAVEAQTNSATRAQELAASIGTLETRFVEVQSSTEHFHQLVTATKAGLQTSISAGQEAIAAQLREFSSVTAETVRELEVRFNEIQNATTSRLDTLASATRSSLADVESRLTEAQKRESERFDQVVTATAAGLRSSISAGQECIAAQVREFSSATTETVRKLELRFNEIQSATASRLDTLASATMENGQKLTPPLSEIESRVVQSGSAITARLDELASNVRQIVPAAPPRYEEAAPYIEGMPERDVLALAASVAVLRPLVPYPNWRFDAEWQNIDLAYRLRHTIWTYFNRRKIPGAIDVPWYYGLKLRLYLGNDLSKQLFVAGCNDPNEFALLDKVLAPGMVFVDVGANEGLYSIFAAARVGSAGQVWAVEPSKREMQRVVTNLELNGLSHVQTLAIAIADKNGEERLLVADYEHEGHNTLGEFIYDTRLLAEEMVPVRRLDAMVDEHKIRRIDFIKMDIEGAELRLLKGAQKTLKRFRPFILFEANERSLQKQGASCNEIVDFLHARSYRLYRFDAETGMPAPAFDGQYSDNMLAVPPGRYLPASAFLPTPEVSAQG